MEWQIIASLIEYSHNSAKSSGSLWKYHKDDSNDNIKDSELFEFKAKITRKHPTADNTKDIEIAMPLKYMSNFWMTLEMALIDCKINQILTWSVKCAINNSPVTGIFEENDTKIYVPVVALSIQDKGTRSIKIKVQGNNKVE